MTQLAILGHETRGKEVIEILEMLGGKLSRQLSGGASSSGYYISSDGKIDYKFSSCFNDDVIQFTLEEFLEKFPYKVGDRVKTIYGKIGTVSKPIWSNRNNCIRYELETDTDSFYFTNELQPYKEETMKNKLEQITLDIPNGYEFFGIDDDNKIVLTKKQSQYPKTYEECCDILEYPHNIVGGYKAELLSSFQNLLICRDVYWKIAGEQMGLGKPWKPDWTTNDNVKYVIEVYFNKVKINSQCYTNATLSFPTAEMRDVFYENFKDLIEACKELL